MLFITKDLYTKKEEFKKIGDLTHQVLADHIIGKNYIGFLCLLSTFSRSIHVIKRVSECGYVSLCGFMKTYCITACLLQLTLGK